VGFMPLDRLRPPARRDPEVAGNVVGRAAEPGEQRAARQKHKRYQIDEQGRLDCPWPLNLTAPPQTDNCRGIALSGFQHSATKHYSAWGRCLHLWPTLIPRVA
jgi:hypothetical protein